MPPQRRFRSTHWSVIARAIGVSQADRRRAWDGFDAITTGIGVSILLTIAFYIFAAMYLIIVIDEFDRDVLSPLALLTPPLWLAAWGLKHVQLQFPLPQALRWAASPVHGFADLPGMMIQLARKEFGSIEGLQAARMLVAWAVFLGSLLLLIYSIAEDDDCTPVAQMGLAAACLLRRLSFPSHPLLLTAAGRCLIWPPILFVLIPVGLITFCGQRHFGYSFTTSIQGSNAS